MSTSNCLDFLNAYADLLSSAPSINPSFTGFRPHPVFFSGKNCQGSVWPSLSEDPVSTLPVLNPDSTNFGSMYVPPGWTVTLFDVNTNNRGNFPSTASNLPILITDATTVAYPNTSQTILNTVTSASCNAPESIDTWQLQMCNNEVSTVVGARHLQSWQAGSTECDNYMTSYCSRIPTELQRCAPGSTEPAALPTEFKYCACLVEENCLRDTFCEDSTTPNCVNNDAFQEFIPVTCFGKNCSLFGYRWRRMQNQRCTITLCQQIISLVGQDIFVDTNSTIWCGNSKLTISASPTITPTPNTHTNNVVLPMWVWILIGIAVFIVAVVTPLSVIIYRRSYKKSSQSPSYVRDQALVPEANPVF